LDNLAYYNTRIVGNSVRTVTRVWVYDSRIGVRFQAGVPSVRPVLGPSSLLSNGHRVPSPGINRWGVLLATHLHLMPKVTEHCSYLHLHKMAKTLKWAAVPVPYRMSREEEATLKEAIN
jgi:hypothetical protein